MGSYFHTNKKEEVGKMDTNKSKTQSQYAETYGGLFGGLLPLLAMIVAMIVLAAFGMRSTKNFWSAGFLAVFVGFLVYKNKGRFQTAVIDGIKNNIFAFMIACFVFAGILSKILAASHLVNSLLWLLSKLHMSPGLMPFLCFLIAVILSTATGSAASSMNATAPIMIPLSVAMGCDVNVVCGAILSGACFGDNLAPISDTTIASSLTQEANVIYVVRSRLKYSLIAGAIAAIAFIIVGLKTTNAAAAQALTVDATYASSLVFLVIPVLIVVLMLKRANLLTAFLISEVLGIAMLFAFGYVDAKTLVAANGPIASGIDGMLSSILFILFIFVVVSLITEAGVLAAMLDRMKKYAKSEKSGEIASGAMVSIISIAISSGTTAITCCGPIIRSLLRPFHIDRNRAANFLDGLGCGVGYLVPTNAGCLNLAAIAVAAGVVSQGYNPIEFVIYNFHSMALVVVFWFAILSGWGRKKETPEMLAAQGIVDATVD